MLKRPFAQIPRLLILGTYVGSCICGGLLTSTANAQEQSATYLSQLDEDMTIRHIGLLPVSDNTDGIYARPTEAQLISILHDSHRWDYVDTNVNGAVSLIDLEENPAKVQDLLKGSDADAVLGAALSKGPSGLSIRLDLFMKKDGKVLAQEIAKDLPRFELAEVRDQVSKLYKKLITKVPYEGLILSRQGNRVTINLGKSDGLVKDQTVTAVQILSVNRHPKFNFLISSEKEILGRIKILKVDETLSFGAITAEKERGAIRKYAKVSGVSGINYGDPASLNEGPSTSDLSGRADANTSFGKAPREWLPIRPPSFGEVGAKFGLGIYRTNVALNSGGLTTWSYAYPSLALFGELWVTPEWTVRADLMQGIIKSSNPRSGSTPTDLNQSMSRYSLDIEYNFLLRDDFFGPKLTLSGGFMTYRMYVDDTTPTAFTTVNYSGFQVGLGGLFPLADDKVWFAGGRLNLIVFPAMSESPVSSGSSTKNMVENFTLTVERKIAENMRFTGAIEFAEYDSSISGQGSRADGEYATSLSQSHTIFTGGVVYMF